MPAVRLGCANARVSRANAMDDVAGVVCDRCGLVQDAACYEWCFCARLADDKEVVDSRSEFCSGFKTMRNHAARGTHPSGQDRIG